MILKNAMKTPDGTVIESAHRHDYVTHTDKNGKTYMVDGGTEYLRRSSHRDQVDMSIYSSAGHAHNRKYFKWGTYGIKGDEPYRQVILMNMSTNHILAIIETQDHISAEVRDLFFAEITWREKNHG